MSRPSRNPTLSSGRPDDLLLWAQHLLHEARAFEQAVGANLQAVLTWLDAETVGAEEDAWTRANAHGRLVRFTYADLPGGKALLTAHRAGHTIDCSVMRRSPGHALTREAVERHFHYHLPALSH